MSGTYDIVAIGVDCVFEMRTDNEKNSEKKKKNNRFQKTVCNEIINRFYYGRSFVLSSFSNANKIQFIICTR